MVGEISSTKINKTLLFSKYRSNHGKIAVLENRFSEICIQNVEKYL